MILKANPLQAWQRVMLSRDREKQAFMQAKILPYLLDRQKRRFATQGASEGPAWAPLKRESYRLRKLRDFSIFPGGGKLILTATSRLAHAAGGEPMFGGDYQKIVAPKGLIVRYGVPYGRFLNDGTGNMVARNFITFSSDTMLAVRKMITDYFTEPRGTGE